MKSKISNRTIIERFSRQQDQQSRYLLALGLFVLAGVLAFLLEWLFPVLRAYLAWRVFIIILLIVLGIGFLAVLILGSQVGSCPVCGYMLGEEFWTAIYCPRCGTKLRDK